jgi:predicted PolB exonuclease-like 3'-5' exonuclease
MPSYEDFYNMIETDFDFEIAEQLKDSIQKITIHGEQAKHDIENMKAFCHSIRKFETRKQQAEHIITTYDTRSSYVFNLLDNKPLTQPQWIKIINQKFLTEQKR